MLEKRCGEDSFSSASWVCSAPCPNDSTCRATCADAGSFAQAPSVPGSLVQRVVQEIGQPNLNGNGHVGTSEKRLSQLGIVMNRTTDRATMKVRFNADEQELFEEALHLSAQRLRTVQRELSNSALNQATMR